MANVGAGDSKTSGSSDTQAAGAVVPDKIDRYLDVIVYSPDGELILIGASSLTTTLWRGSAWVLKDATLPADGCLKLSPANCETGISVESGVSSGIFLNNRTLVLGCDSGAVRFHEAKVFTGIGDGPTPQLELQGVTNDHSSAVSDLDVLGNENSVISCSQDSSIKVWDVSSLTAQHSFIPAHSRMVTSVKTQPNSSHTFASTSVDGTALMWDIRLSKPASSLYTSEGIGLTALAWSGSDEVVLGAVSGGLTVVDIRKLAEPSQSSKIVPRPVHKLQSCSHDSSVVAVCQDSSQFAVMKCKDGSIASNVYQDNRHEDFVRSVAWHPTRETAVTCSWDSTVLRHSIPISEPMNGF